MSKPLRSSDFRHRVRIEIPVASQDQTSGEVTHSFSLLAVVGAAIEPDNGTEGLQGGLGVAGQLYTRIRIRWAPALANLGPSHRIVRAGLAGRDDITYNIVAVLETSFERRQIVLRCTSGVNQG